MTISAVSLSRTRKRERENEDESLEDILKKFSRIDRLTAKEARRLFLESDSSLLRQGLKSQSVGSLSTVHSIHKKARSLCDPKQVKDRSVLRLIKQQLPEALAVDSLLSLEQLQTLQKYLCSCSGIVGSKRDKRLGLICEETGVEIGERGPLKFNFVPSSERENRINKIVGSLFQKALEAAYKLDGPRALGKYKARLFIIRDEVGIKKAGSLKGLKMHHDYGYTASKKPGQFPKYLFLGMLSDRGGKDGWEGGDLIVQNDRTSRPHVTFKERRPYLRYHYPLNEGICVRNREVIHQRTKIVAKSPTMKVARDLLIIHLFDKEVE